MSSDERSESNDKANPCSQVLENTRTKNALSRSRFRRQQLHLRSSRESSNDSSSSCATATETGRRERETRQLHSSTREAEAGVACETRSRQESLGTNSCFSCRRRLASRESHARQREMTKLFARKVSYARKADAKGEEGSGKCFLRKSVKEPSLFMFQESAFAGGNTHQGRRCVCDSRQKKPGNSLLRCCCCS